MRDHAPLREREREERADREQGDPGCSVIPNATSSTPAVEGQVRDADGEHEPPADDRERLGQVAIAGDVPAQAREVDEAGVRGEREHRRAGARSRCDRSEPRPATAAGELRQHALVARAASWSMAEMPYARHERADPAAGSASSATDRGSACGARAGAGLLERADAVADGLDPGHRGAAARERAEQEPDRDGLARRARGRRAIGLRAPAGGRRSRRAPSARSAQEAGDERVRGQREQAARRRGCRARFTSVMHREDAEAELEDVLVQAVAPPRRSAPRRPRCRRRR